MNLLQFVHTNLEQIIKLFLSLNLTLFTVTVHLIKRACNNHDKNDFLRYMTSFEQNGHSTTHRGKPTFLRLWSKNEGNRSLRPHCVLLCDVIRVALNRLDFSLKDVLFTDVKKCRSSTITVKTMNSAKRQSTMCASIK